MTKHLTIEATETLATAIKLLLDSQSSHFLVTQNNKPIGTLNRDEIIQVLSKKEDNVSIDTIMNKNLIFLEADWLLEDVFDVIYKNKSSLMLVTENGQFIGTLDTENLLEFILIREVKAKKNNY